MVIDERIVHMLFCTKNPTWSTLGSNLGVLVQHSATYRLRYGGGGCEFVLSALKTRVCAFFNLKNT